MKNKLCSIELEIVLNERYIILLDVAIIIFYVLCLLDVDWEQLPSVVNYVFHRYKSAINFIYFFYENMF